MAKATDLGGVDLGGIDLGIGRAVRGGAGFVVGVGVSKKEKSAEAHGSALPFVTGMAVVCRVGCGSVA